MPKVKPLLIKFLLAAAVIVLIIRLAMPYAILRYVEYRFAKIPEYQAKIADLEVHLIRGAYTIKGFDLLKVNKHIPVPYFHADQVYLQVQWRALLRGKLAARMHIERPALNLVIDPQGENQQLTINEEWQNAVKALFPLNFNRVTISDGTLSFQSFTSRPPFKLFLKNIDAQLDNLRNVERRQQKLSSTLEVDAEGMDGSPVDLSMNFDPFAKEPAFDLDFEIKRMNIAEANNFLQHYTRIKVKKGLFSLYVEAAAEKGKIAGYAKPIIEHLEVADPKDNDSPLEALYKGALELLAKILENPQQKSVATKIAIKGNIDNPDTSLWGIISNLLHHAFIQALVPKIDNSVDMRDVELR